MSIYYLSTDRTSGDRPLPPVSFMAEAFHQYDEKMNDQLTDMVYEWGDPSTAHTRPASTAWRFRRFKDIPDQK